MLIPIFNFMSQVVWTCLLIYAIEMTKETLPGRFLIHKAVEFSEFLIDLLKKIITKNLNILT